MGLWTPKRAHSCDVPGALPAHSPCIPTALLAHSTATKNVIFTPITIGAWRASRCSRMHYELHGGRNKIFDEFCPGAAKSASAIERAFATSDCETGNGRRSARLAKNCAAPIMHSIFMHFRVRNDLPNALATVLPMRLRESA